jgi:uncharacterized membrane protein YeaQ/YmgE (transglycosylase-associated protein family)
MVMSGESIVVILIVGLIAGGLAGKIVEGHGVGLIISPVVGAAGCCPRSA